MAKKKKKQKKNSGINYLAFLCDIWKKEWFDSIV